MLGLGWEYIESANLFGAEMTPSQYEDFQCMNMEYLSYQFGVLKIFL